MVEQTLNIAAVSLLPQERTTADLLPGTHWVTAALTTSSLLYLSKAVRVECPRRSTHYQNMSSGCCGECSCPQVNLNGTYPDNEVHFRTLAACGAVV